MSLSKDGLRRAALTLAVVFAAIWYSVFIKDGSESGPMQPDADTTTSGAPGVAVHHATALNNATMPETP